MIGHARRVQDQATDTGWLTVTDEWFTGPLTAGGSGALGGTLTHDGAEFTLAGTPAAVQADGTNEMSYQKLSAPFSLDMGDTVLARWRSISTSGASSWSLVVFVGEADPTSGDGSGGGFCGAVTRGGVVVAETADTKTAEAAGIDTIDVSILTSLDRLMGANIAALASDVTLETRGRGTGNVTLTGPTLHLGVGTIDASQNAGSLSGVLDVRRIKAAS